ncbi:hypothetical protein [Paucisalibacillus globulus]|nr:hypothetical protein [Paucisalibacillus globulus]
MVTLYRIYGTSAISFGRIVRCNWTETWLEWEDAVVIRAHGCDYWEHGL